MRRLLSICFSASILVWNGGCFSNEAKENAQDVHQVPSVALKANAQDVDKSPSVVLKVEDAAVVAVSHDGKQAITYNQWSKAPKQLHLWDVESAKLTRPMELGFKPPPSLLTAQFSPEGDKLLAYFCNLQWDNVVRVFDLATGKELHRFAQRDNLFGGRDAVWAPDGKHILVGPQMRLWSLETGNEARDFQTGGSVLGFSEDGKIAYACDSGVIRRWNAMTGESLGEFKFGEAGISYLLRFARNNRAMTTAAGVHRGVAVWELSTGKKLTEIRFDPKGNRVEKDGEVWPRGPFEFFSEISGFVLSAGGDRALLRIQKVHRIIEGKGGFKTQNNTTLEAKVVLWDLQHDKVLRTFPGAVGDERFPVLISGDGKTALIGTSAGYQVWKMLP